MPDHRLLKSWRQRLRLSVRGLIVLVLIVGAGLGWLVRSGRVQRDAVAAIQRAGGNIRYDWEEDGAAAAIPVGGRPFVPNVKPRWPKWLVDSLGVDYFGYVVEVDLFDHGRDADLVHIARLSQLQTLILARSAVTDAGLAHLAGLNRLKGLYLGGTAVGDAGMAHLAGLTCLQGLGLDDTQVGDVGLAHLEGLTGLQQLILSSTKVTDAGLVHLKRLNGLRILSLDNTHITDAKLAFMRGLTGLKFLQLEYTQVSDAGLIWLRGLTGLEELRVSRLHVSDSAKRELQRALPRTRITRE
jgi:internalin A